MIITIVNRVFKELTSLWVNWQISPSLKTQEGVDGYKRKLFELFQAHKINTVEKIKTGLQRAETESLTREYLPNPGVFVGWCKARPEDLGLLSARKAYLAACNAGRGRRWPDEVVWKTAQEFGLFKLRTEPEERNAKPFADLYLEMVERYANGERFSIPEEARIEAKPERVLSKSENAKRMESLKCLLT